MGNGLGYVEILLVLEAPEKEAQELANVEKIAMAFFEKWAVQIPWLKRISAAKVSDGSLKANTPLNLTQLWSYPISER